ncbi:hypothetical protein ACI8AV_18670 [Geodermatophilus sp. SYSU D00804]
MAEVRPEDRIRDDATGTPPAPGSGAAERVVRLPANPRRTRRA